MRVNEVELHSLAAQLFARWQVGDVVQLVGPLGVGKTTLARGILKAAGHLGVVRSPSFSLLQTYPTEPPILHADFYRLSGDPAGLDLPELIEEHLSLIEWPEQVSFAWPTDRTWIVTLAFDPSDEAFREVTVTEPAK